MAFYPCSNHHAPYRGPSRAAYGAIVDGASADRKHLRLCDACFADYLVAIGAKLEEVDFSGEGPSAEASALACVACDKPGAECRIFVNAYPKGEPERAFWGACHRTCQPAASALVLLT
jgi:hypothetical protein